MMFRKSLVLLSLLSLFSYLGNAQEYYDTVRASSLADLNKKSKPTPKYHDTVPLPPLGVYTRETLLTKTEPVPYPYIREADVLWSKIVWRMIDLRQKINFPLYYPTQRMRDRRSLTQVLYDAIQNKEIYAYDPQVSLMPGDEFVARMSPEEAHERMCGEVQEIKSVNEETGRPTVWLISPELKWEEIKKIMIKEEWFFDTKHSVLQCRVIGICPIREEVDPQTNMVKPRQTFWVYYPEARAILSREHYYNPHNDAQESSYDDLFFKRRFGSYIIRESNEYNNRAIAEYKVGGIPTLLESDRIHNNLFNREHDLWEY